MCSLISVRVCVFVCVCVCVCGLYCSAYCEVAQCALRSGQTPPELKSFSSLAGFQAAPRDAGQCFRQGDTRPVPMNPPHHPPPNSSSFLYSSSSSSSSSAPPPPTHPLATPSHYLMFPECHGRKGRHVYSFNFNFITLYLQSLPAWPSSHTNQRQASSNKFA